MAEEDIEFVTFDGETITKSDYRTEIIEEYIAANYDGLSKVSDFTVGSEAYHLADVIAGFLLEQRELIDSNYRMSMIHTAEGEFLDNFGDMVGVHRKASSPSVGEVTLTRLSSDTTEPLSIPDGLQVSTDDAISFIVDLDGDDTITIPSGESSVTVSVICEQEGAYTNVDPHTIKLVMGDMGNLVSVDNAMSMSDGEDIEDDDEYRNRILLNPYEAPTGSLAWYNNVALTLTDLIHSVKVEKSDISTGYDVDICYKPVDWSKSTEAGEGLEELFNLTDFCIPGIDINYILASQIEVLESDADNTYQFAILTKSGYELNDLKEEIKKVINQFNNDADIAVEFIPTTLAGLIEEITGIAVCKIVDVTSDGTFEVLEQTSMENNQVYKVVVPDNANIVALDFNIGLNTDEEA